jgi:uncharacterized membrane protein required for colicin V production
MSLLDIAILLIIAAFAFYYYRRGFAVSVLTFFSLVISIVLARIVSPFIAAPLRGVNGLYGGLQNWVTHTLKLEEIAGYTIEEFAANLNLPSFAQNQIISHNTPETHQLLNVGASAPISAYVSAFIAGMIINVIAFIIAFVIVFALVRIGIGMVDVATRLPVIRTVNKAAGAALGGLIGVFFAWALLTVCVWVLANEPSINVGHMLDHSVIAGPLQSVNLISWLLGSML